MSLHNTEYQTFYAAHLCYLLVYTIQNTKLSMLPTCAVSLHNTEYQTFYAAHLRYLDTLVAVEIPELGRLVAGGCEHFGAVLCSKQKRPFM